MKYPYKPSQKGPPTIQKEQPAVGVPECREGPSKKQITCTRTYKWHPVQIAPTNDILKRQGTDIRLIREQKLPAGKAHTFNRH